MAAENGNPLTWKQQKRQLKLERKQEKAVRKRARKEEKQAAKLGKRRQREVIAYRDRLDRSDAASLLEELIAGLRAGNVHVEHADRELTIEPADSVDIRVRARQTWKSQGLAIRVRWSRNAANESAAPLKVSAK